ncbi:MAG: hypothetical protein WDN24_08335 [Sphingomonas sp.]
MQSAPVVLPSYATLTGQLLGAPLVIDAQVRNATPLKPADSPGLAPGRIRLLVEADVLALIRGNTTLPARIRYLADVLPDARGKPPKLKKQRVLLFARALPGRPGEIQLTGADGQRNWSAELDAAVRGITRELLASDAPRAVSGVSNAFHVPGSLPGEGETQIFIETAGGAQISVQVLRRPGQQPRWSVSLGDFIDESAGAPAKDTLLWYRLACGLPRELPADSVESDDPANARIAREDYRTVLRELGPCA